MKTRYAININKRFKTGCSNTIQDEHELCANIDGPALINLLENQLHARRLLKMQQQFTNSFS